MRRILLLPSFTIALILTNFFSSYGQQVQSLQTDRTWQEMMHDPNTSFFDTQQKFKDYWTGRPITKGSGYKAFKRWEWFMEPRVDQQGNWPQPDAVWQAMQEQPEMFGTSTYMPGNWSYIGNTSVPTGGGGAGRVNSVRELPGSTTTFFACAPGGGLWKTTNSGTSWSVVGTDFLSSIGVSDVAIDPTNNNIMYIATGDGDAGDTYALGVLKSTDAGTTWNTTGLNWSVNQTRTTNRIMIHPTNTQIVICATNNGLYRTTDGGTSWTQVVAGSFKDLNMKPGDPTTWYACTNQLYKSTDSGATWSLITTGLPASASSQRMAIAVSAANSAVVYILASGTDSGLLGIYKSTDSGATFTQKTGTNPNYLNWDTSATAATGGQGWYDLRIEADPSNANVFFFGGVNIWKSSDGGTTYSLAGHWYGGGGAPYVHADIHAIHFVPGSTRLLVGCDGGVFTTTNGGPNFSDISNNLEIAAIYKLSVANTNSNLVISGWQDNGTNLKNNAAWSRPLGGDGMDCQIDPSNANIMYGEIYYGSINKSTNGGATWSNIVASGGVNEDEDGAWVTPYVLGPNPTHIFVGKSLVYKSTNGGTTFTGSAAFGGTADCNDIAVAPSDANIVYASKGSSLFKSIDNAATFTAVAGMQGSYITDIAIHNTDPNRVWVTFSNYSAGAKIYFTTNGGTTWTNISGTLPNLPANAVAFQPGSSNGIYVGMDAGVYYRDDVLGAFVPYMNALPNMEITELDVHVNSSTITASSFGRGMWRAPLYALPNLDAALVSVNAPTGTYCTTTVTPSLTILNAGTTPIISMTIQYQVGGQALQTYNWVGSITTGASSTITLPNLNYGAGSFTFTATITAVNTLTDDNTANNSAASTYYCINGANTATLTLETDCYPTETSWVITDSGSNVVFSGSGYGSETINNIPLCLDNGCYTFTINDSFGDGLQGGSGCAQGDGNYSITDVATGTVLAVMTVANFGTSKSHSFCYPITAVSGCTITTACNYNPLATINDGSCTFGPANDLCAGALTLTVNAAATTTTNVGTCASAANPSCGGAAAIKDLWYKFVYTGGPVTITTNFTGGTLTDTRLALYTACGGTQIACNDDISGTNFKSQIVVACGTLTYGNTYYIQVGGYNSTTGTFSIQITAPFEVCNLVDDDCDGLIDEGFDADNDGYTSCGGDCNDSNAAIKPGATEVCNTVDDDCDGSIDEGVQTTFYRDQDGDTYGNISVTTLACTAPVGYVSNSLDCNDSNAAIKPGATEVCNTVDDNCNGNIDEGVQSTFYRDFDNDGYGNLAQTTLACTAPVGYVANSTDCNDALATVFPGATETCNTIDDDCDALIDEGVQTTFYRDQDNDGFGNPTVTTQACSAPVGYVSNNTDCNDFDNAIRPGATEVCNTVDDNCNSSIDEGVQTTFYRDQDNDGFGNLSITTLACSAPVGYVSNSTDCNDNNNAVNPAATEVCNTIDDDCDGQTDEGLTNTYYRDQDNDTYGNNAVTIQACSPPAGYVVNNTDCNDNSASVHPGATEICNNIDDDCDGSTDEGVQTTFYRDADNDGYGTTALTTLACTAPVGYVSNSTDCNDAASAVHPGATEVCNNIDDDCDGLTDEGFDNDNDGFTTCGGDCNDNNANIFPGAPEACNSLDDNCDTFIDNGVTFQNYYTDADGDGYGSTLIGNFCTAPANSSLNNLDCNDSNANINPNETEICNNVDDDCNAQIDEGFDNDNDTYTTCEGDCNDNNAAVHPGATEVCNGIDDDCDSSIDEGVLLTFYRDIDGDGYGRSTLTTTACIAPVGYVSNSTDCDDTDNTVHPGATEICNNQDDDCDGLTDEGFDNDNDTYTTCEGDCNDNNAAIHPGATEVCNNSDDDCDGLTDEGFDNDNDGYSTCDGDCNDNDAAIHPGVTDLCNGVDDDCNLAIDDDATFQNYYTDNDGDGYGNGLIGNFCSPPANSSPNNLDCNDNNSSIHPTQTETCNGIDDDCDTTIDDGFDVDNDGYTTCNGDCNDNNAAVHPGATEICNALDDDCDGLTNELLPLLNWYIDADNDGYGSAVVSPVQACGQPAGYVANNTDCNDGAFTVHPNATEICGNGIDEDCDALVDEGCNVGTAPNDNMNTAVNIQSTGNYYPSCSSLVGTCAGATVSSEGNPFNVTTGEDVWYRFHAMSSGIRIQLNAGAFDGVLELHDNTGNEIVHENNTGFGQTEVLNFNGLLEGATYYIAVRNYNSTQGTGSFTLCAQILRDSFCANTTLPICGVLKAGWAASTSYVFHFTQLPSGPTTSVTTNGVLSLSNTTLALVPGQSYSVTIDAVFNLADGAGSPEITTVYSNQPCTITIAAQDDMQVKDSQRCPATLGFNSYLQGVPMVCGAVGHKYEFTKTDAVGTPLAAPFVVTSSASFAYQVLSFTNPQPLQAGAYYSVRIKPIFPNVEGTWGTPRCIRITPINGGIIENDEEEKPGIIEDESTQIVFYPNPGNGHTLNLNIADANAKMVQLRLIDNVGQTVHSSQYAMDKQLNANILFSQPLASGIYLMEIIMNDKTYIRRISIQR